MQEMKRRKSVYRATQRKHDFSSLLNRMIVDSNEFSLRESLNPLAEERLFTLISQDRRLSNEGLTSLLKLVEREVLVIGFILPSKWLARCWQLLTGSKQTNFNPKNINCAILNKSMLVGTNTILLMLEENEEMLGSRPDILEKIVTNLSFVLVVSQRVIEKRLPQWETEELLLERHAGILVIKEESAQLPDESLQKIEDIFWNMDTACMSELDSQGKKTLKVPQFGNQRQAYQPMNEEEEEDNGLRSRLLRLSEMSLKKNWKISKGLLCYPFLYLLNAWISDEQRDPRLLLQASLLSYSKSLEDQFAKFIENFKLPLDELKFRNSIETEKKQILLNARKHIFMLENIFPKFQLTTKTLEGLGRFFSEKARELYEANNNIASKLNEALLQRLYEEIINKKFYEERTDRTIDDFQNDFSQLLEVYGAQSFRVSSQLKTFNEFLQTKKYEFAENVGKELQVEKKKYYSEKEELEDRLEIQKGVLDTLETELKELEERRQKIDSQNNQLKKTIEGHTKKGEMASEYNSTSRKKYFETIDRKAAKVENRQTGKEAAKKEGKCCCQIM